jgi:hypothetical protein
MMRQRRTKAANPVMNPFVDFRLNPRYTAVADLEPARKIAREFLSIDGRVGQSGSFSYLRTFNEGGRHEVEHLLRLQKASHLA